MEYRVLGKTGLKVSAVGFGGIPVQRISSDETCRVIKIAEEAGINFIDTARGYTVSEQLIGEALKGRRENWIIASKTMARDKASMQKEVQISLKNLQTDYIDLYQFHNIRTELELERIFEEDGAYAALSELKEKGIIRHIGITSHSLDTLKLAVETEKFETVMYPYNIVEKQGEELFKRASELNIGVIAMKPMAGGNLSEGIPALKFILRNKNISTAIPGMASIEEVKENASAVDGYAGLTEEETKYIDEVSKELSGEFCRRCGYCLPCKESIDIPAMFLFKNYKAKYKLSDWAEDRYFSNKSTAKNCVECGACEKRCPYGLPIRKMLKEVKVLFNDI